MSGVLVLGEHLRGRLRETTAQAVAAGRELSDAGAGPLAVAVVAADPAAIREAASLEGVDEIIEVAVPADEFDADLHAAALEALVRNRTPAIVLMGMTANSMIVGPFVAARLKLGFASDVVACGLEGGALVARRQFYAGKVEAELEFPGRSTVVLLLRPGIWPEPAAGGRPEVVSLDVAAAPTRTKHRELVDPTADEFDISKADVILAIGRGIGERENIARLESLAERMGVALASSRPLVDAGWMSKARQVGQSGVSVKPKLYIALGISGAVQHLTGMRGSETIVAVNEDPNAPIFGVAHYGAVEDMFAVVEELESLW